MASLRKGLYALLMLLACLTVQAGKVTYVYTDPQGTPLAEADASGNVTAAFDYKPYGAQALGNTTDGVGYTGHVADMDTSLIYMQARYYDPIATRFVSVDYLPPAAGDIYKINRFSYGSNNPIVNIDPDGKDPVYLYTNPAYAKALGANMTPQQAKATVAAMGAIYTGGLAAIGATPVISSFIGAIGNVGFTGAVIIHTPEIVTAGGLAAEGLAVANGAAGPSSAAEGAAFSGAGRVASAEADFFAGTSYTTKVLGQMKQGDFHAFPESVKAFQGAGQAGKIVGGDGVARDILKIPGGYKGKDGVFEFIKESDGSINHRYFRIDQEK